MDRRSTPVCHRLTVVGSALIIVAVLLDRDRRVPSLWSSCILIVVVLCDLAVLIARWKATRR